MTANNLLLIHGMGTHKKNAMTKDFVDAMKEAARLWGLGDDFDIKQHTTIHEFNYSDIMDEYQQKLKNTTTEALDQLQAMAGVDDLIQIVNRLHTAIGEIEDDDFIFTHWLDVAIYTQSGFAESLRIKLADQINDLLLNGDGKPLHIIAHSLGTAVLNDTIEKFYDESSTGQTGPNGKPYLNPGTDTIATIWTLANVSNLTRILFDVDTGDNPTVVRPVGTGEDGVCSQLFNSYHIADPFCVIRRYEPDYATANIVNRVFRKKNTHSFYEYVVQPRVSGGLLSALADKREVEDQQNYLSAQAAYESGTPNEKAGQIIAKVEALDTSDVDDYIDVLKLVRELKNAIEVIWDRE